MADLEQRVDRLEEKVSQLEIDINKSLSDIKSSLVEIKAKYRISNKAYTGSNTTIWYYPLCKLPIDNNGDYASAIISGRIGGWVSENMSYINALAWNRNGTGISLFDIAGTAGSMASIWGICDIVVYTNAETVSPTTYDNGEDIVYLKCKQYFAFDLDLEMFQSTAEILYDGTYLTTEPTGTLVAQASTNPQQPIQNKPFGLQGKIIDNLEVVKGTDIVLITTRGHITCSKYGVIYDSFDPGDRIAEYCWIIV